jgi:inner membrane protein YidH
MNNTELKLNDLLAIDRTRLAAERSLMAWVRTALSMITFGFTIYKVLQAIQAQSTVPALQPYAPRNAGLTLIGIGTFALITAAIQHWKYVRKLSNVQSHSPLDLALMIACLLALLGFLMIGGIIFKSGPFD